MSKQVLQQLPDGVYTFEDWQYTQAIIPAAILDTIPAATVAGMVGCEAQYHAGRYYVTVPPDAALYRQRELLAEGSA